MNERKFNKLTSRGIRISRRMKKTAVFIVDNKMIRNPELTQEQRSDIIGFTAASMAIGEKLARRSTLIQGAIIGTVLTVGYFKVREIIKKEDQKTEE